MAVSRSNVGVPTSWVPIVLGAATNIRVQNKGFWPVQVVVGTSAPAAGSAVASEVIMPMSWASLPALSAGDNWYAKLWEIEAPGNAKSMVLVEVAA